MYTPAPKTSVEAIAPSETRATGPIQPRFTARTKKKTIPSSVTAPPAQASAFAPKNTDQSISRGSRVGSGGSGFGAGLGAGGGIRDSVATGAQAGGGGTTGAGGTSGSGNASCLSSASSFSSTSSLWPKSSSRNRRSTVIVVLLDIAYLLLIAKML